MKTSRAVSEKTRDAYISGQKNRARNLSLIPGSLLPFTHYIFSYIHSSILFEKEHILRHSDTSMIYYIPFHMQLFLSSIFLSKISYSLSML